GSSRSAAVQLLPSAATFPATDDFAPLTTTRFSWPSDAFRDTTLSTGTFWAPARTFGVTVTAGGASLEAPLEGWVLAPPGEGSPPAPARLLEAPQAARASTPTETSALVARRPERRDRAVAERPGRRTMDMHELPTLCSAAGSPTDDRPHKGNG